MFRDDARKAKKRKKTSKATLSFAMDDERDADVPSDAAGDRRASPRGESDDVEDGQPAKRGKFRKNPDVDTSFLPDREREEAERKERERLRLEWLAKQEDIKQEEIEVVYSYWDGSGHRKSVTVSSFPRPMLRCSSCGLEILQIVQERRWNRQFLGKVSATISRTERCQR